MIKKTLSLFFLAGLALSHGNVSAQSIGTPNYWRLVSGNLQPVSTVSTFSLPFITNATCIGTDINGKFINNTVLCGGTSSSTGITSINGATSTAQIFVGGTGVSVSTSNPTTTITNIGVTQLNAGGCVTVSATTTNVTLGSTCVTSVTASNGLVSSGGTTPNISLSSSTVNGQLLIGTTAGTWSIALPTSSAPLSWTYGAGTLSIGCATCLTGNQNITITASGDASGSGSGATAITVPLTITGLQGKALPAVATGTLQFVNGAWILNNVTSSVLFATSTGAFIPYPGTTCAAGTALTALSNAASGTCIGFATSTLTIPVSVANGGTGTTTASAKGSVEVGFSATQIGSVAVGPNSTATSSNVLMSSSSVAAGVAFTNIPTGWDFLGSTFTNASATSTSVLSFSAREQLEFKIIIAGYGGSDVAALRFNADSGANYWTRWMDSTTGLTSWATNQKVSQTFFLVAAVSSTVEREVTIDCSNHTSFNKLCTGVELTDTGSAATAGTADLGWGEYFTVASQINSVQVITSGGQTLNASTSIEVFGKNP